MAEKIYSKIEATIFDNVKRVTPEIKVAEKVVKHPLYFAHSAGRNRFVIAPTSRETAGASPSQRASYANFSVT